MTKIRVGILFGGQSGEHEVSIASAESVLGALDRSRYEAVPLGITRAGDWIATDSPQTLLLGTDSMRTELGQNTDGSTGLRRVQRAGEVGLREAAVDVVFPILHGPRGEDGTVQGLLELAGVPYVGSGVLASAVSMDKAMMKAVFAAAGLRSVPYLTVDASRWQREPDACVSHIERHIAYPVFVKPCNMGSSVGISKAEGTSKLHAALELAMKYDRRVIVEQGVDAREVECGVLGNEDVLVSVPGEIVPHGRFYDYESKYTEGLADLEIPARLTAEQTRTVQSLSTEAFVAVGGSGLARVDFFVMRDSGEIMLNEINTMPGFTRTSMYPKLWEATGVPYGELISRLIDLALERHASRPRYDHR